MRAAVRTAALDRARCGAVESLRTFVQIHAVAASAVLSSIALDSGWTRVTG